MGAFDHLEWTYDGAFEQLFGLGRGKFEQKFSKNSNARGVARGDVEASIWLVHYIQASSSAKNIGVIFDSHVNLEKHVMNTCKMAFYHLRNIARIRNSLSQDDAETLVHAFISSKLDFCNALLYGLPKSVKQKNINTAFNIGLD